MPQLSHRPLPFLAALFITAGIGPNAEAAEVYSGLGLQGVLLGFSQPLHDRFSLRADFSTLGSLSRTRTEEGIRYNISLQAYRSGIFGDWYLTGSNFRLTAGLTVNNFKGDLVASGAGSTYTIGNTPYTFTANDRFDVRIKFPSTTPYLGIGWGHHKSERGWGFHADLGASFGKARVTGTVSGPMASLVNQADIDAELAQLRNGVGKITFIPQLSAGFSYRF